MANRMFNQFQGSLEKGIVTLYCNIPIGATGSVGTLDPKKNKGIVSVVRTGTGAYTITFGVSASRLDTYARTMTMEGTILNATPDAIGSINMTADNAATGSISIVTQAAASGTVTDPSNGTVILLEITLKNSSV